MLKDIPAPSIAASTPPDYSRTYFEHCADYPFEPNANHCPLVNAWWMAEAAYAAYDQFDERGNARINLQPLRDQGWGIHAASEEHTQFIALESKAALIIAFRGTRLESFALPSLSNALVKPHSGDAQTDANLILKNLGNGIRVHKGFWLAFAPIRDRFESEVARARNHGKNVWLCGHSLGGALAMIGGWLCQGSIRGICTVGSPRVGNAAFAEKVIRSVRAYRRIVHHRDLVSCLPPEWLPVAIDPGSAWAWLNPFRAAFDRYAHGSDASLISGQQSSDIAEGAAASLALADLAHDARAHFDEVMRVMRSGFDPKNPGTWPVLFDALSDHAPVYYANKLFNACAKEKT